MKLCGELSACSDLNSRTGYTANKSLAESGPVGGVRQVLRNVSNNMRINMYFTYKYIFMSMLDVYTFFIIYTHFFCVYTHVGVLNVYSRLRGCCKYVYVRSYVWPFKHRL